MHSDQNQVIDENILFKFGQMERKRKLRKVFFVKTFTEIYFPAGDMQGRNF